MMRFFRSGVLVFISIAALLGSGCGYYNKVMTRKSLVDGSKAYKDRKFKEAEQLFRDAVSRDPKGETTEGKTAQLFLARTIHSEYIGNRSLSFSDADFTGDSGLGLVNKIWAKADPLSQWLSTQLSPDTQAKYNAFNSAPTNNDDAIKKKNELQKSLLSQVATDLNKLINSGQSIYDPARFSKVTLSDFTKQYMAEQPSGEKITRLNRLLLEDAYPNDIARKPKPEDAIAEYQKALAVNPNDQSSYKAIASLYENLQKPEEWLKWVTARANNTSIPPEQRAEALTSLAAKKNTCSNDISDTDQTKKKVTKDGKDVYEFVKPSSAEDFEKLKGCVDEGTKLIDQALALEPQDVKSAASIVPSSLTDAQLAAKLDLLKVFESARSYKASLLIQAMRLAEMEGRTADRDRLKQEADAARKNFLDLSDVVKKLGAEVENREAAKEAAKTGGEKQNTNTPANKK